MIILLLPFPVLGSLLFHQKNMYQVVSLMRIQLHVPVYSSLDIHGYFHLAVRVFYEAHHYHYRYLRSSLTIFTAGVANTLCNLNQS